MSCPIDIHWQRRVRASHGRRLRNALSMSTAGNESWNLTLQTSADRGISAEEVEAVADGNDVATSTAPRGQVAAVIAQDTTIEAWSWDTSDRETDGNLLLKWLKAKVMPHQVEQIGEPNKKLLFYFLSPSSMRGDPSTAVTDPTPKASKVRRAKPQTTSNLRFEWLVFKCAKRI